PLALLAADEFRLPPPLWARIVSDFAVAYHERRLPREHLLRALTPLYLARTAAFIVHVRAMPLGRMPEAFETIDRAFEDERDHLVARWRKRMRDSWADILVRSFREVALRLAGYAPRVLAVLTLVLAGWIVAAV